MSARTRSLAVTIVVAAGLAGCLGEPEGPLQMEGGVALSVENADCAPALSDERLEDLIAVLRAEVAELGEEGFLNEGQVRALTNHLDTALGHLLEEAYCPLRAALNAFREQTDELVGEGELSDREAYELRRVWRLTDPPEDVPPTHAEAYAPGVVGEPRSIPMPSGEFRYEVIDGLAIFGGDAILGYADEFESQFDGLEGAAPTGGPARTGLCAGPFLFFCNRWPNQTVHYDIQSTSWGDPATNAAMTDRIARAVRHWEDSTGIDFRRSFGEHMLVFRDANGCSSWLGMDLFTISEPQWVNVSEECSFGAIVHEIGHAVGVQHEQGRGDRDDFVRVDYGQVAEGSREQFYLYWETGSDVGEYDYGSIMHYGCDWFQKDGASGPTIEPILPGFGCADIGQRSGFSEKDIYGVYHRYRPEYRIVGAEPGESRDRLALSLEWSTEPVLDKYLFWTIDRVDRATGPTFSTLEAGLTPGTYTVFAEIRIGGVFLMSVPLTFTVLENQPPAVDLGPDVEVFEEEAVSVFASVEDAEDGDCPLSVCAYSWDPVPTTDRGAVADYVFEEAGEYTVSVTVEDGTGATGTDEMVVRVVERTLVPIITEPSPGRTFNPGASTSIAAYALWGGEPIGCLSFQGTWSSSDPEDEFVSFHRMCEGENTITFGPSPGERTITLEATVGLDGPIVEATVTVVVEACDGNCAPDVSFDVLPESELDGSHYDPPFAGPGYFLTTPLQIHGFMRDPDGATGAVIDYGVRVHPPCFLECPEPIEVAAGSAGNPVEALIAWTPASDVAEWDNCAITALPHRIVFWARDALGAEREMSRTVYLACPLR